MDDHSAVSYMTLGHGDLIMTSSWKLLGPVEAADGILMFGVWPAIIFAVLQRLIKDAICGISGAELS